MDSPRAQGRGKPCEAPQESRNSCNDPLRLFASPKNPNKIKLPDLLPGANFESCFFLERPPKKEKRPALLEPPRVVAFLAQAESFRLQMDLGLVKHFAELADANGLARPRVTQLMKLLMLPPEVLRFVKSLGPGLRPNAITERKLQRLFRLPGARRMEEARKCLPGFKEFLLSEQGVQAGRAAGDARLPTA